MKSAL